MAGKILLSTAYLPPVEYFSIISRAEKVLIEREENYVKQSFRNRCYILSAHGAQLLSVPVYLGSLHKTQLKDIRIDYSKRWQQVHIGAITASYSASPYFQFYFENIEKVISEKHAFLIDLNTDITETILKMLRLNIQLGFTSEFETPAESPHDFRYKISPKKKSGFFVKEYLQVFNNAHGFVHGLSIIDLVFNMGPEAVDFL
jgi:hypothetical protein